MGACKQQASQTIKPSYTNLTEAVYASVTLKAADQYMAFTTVNGIVKKVQVTEGDVVTKGQALFTIENNNQALATQSARLGVALAKDNLAGNQSKLEEISRQIEVAKLKLSNDSLTYHRQKNLWDNNIGSKSQLDQFYLVY